jgi:hypothetical protein
MRATVIRLTPRSFAVSSRASSGMSPAGSASRAAAGSVEPTGERLNYFSERPGSSTMRPAGASTAETRTGHAPEISWLTVPGTRDSASSRIAARGIGCRSALSEPRITAMVWSAELGAHWQPDRCQWPSCNRLGPSRVPQLVGQVRASKRDLIGKRTERGALSKNSLWQVAPGIPCWCVTGV